MIASVDDMGVERASALAVLSGKLEPVSAMRNAMTALAAKLAAAEEQWLELSSEYEEAMAG